MTSHNLILDDNEAPHDQKMQQPEEKQNSCPPRMINEQAQQDAASVVAGAPSVVHAEEDLISFPDETNGPDSQDLTLSSPSQGSVQEQSKVRNSDDFQSNNPFRQILQQRAENTSTATLSNTPLDLITGSHGEGEVSSNITTTLLLEDHSAPRSTSPLLINGNPISNADDKSVVQIPPQPSGALQDLDELMTDAQPISAQQSVIKDDAQLNKSPSNQTDKAEELPKTAASNLIEAPSPEAGSENKSEPESLQPESQSVNSVNPTESSKPDLPERPVEKDSAQPPVGSTAVEGVSKEPLPSDLSGPQTHNAAPRTNRDETYQIKHVNWFDDAAHKMRQTPILVQNANGPCPLLALVNTRLLSTPIDMNTTLYETLRLRERVSLSLVLDAVFDELVSGQYQNPLKQLPDVGELYAFLAALHTGMNVNPKFISSEPLIASSQGGAIGNDRQPGEFENTTEMRLYSTFGIPLVHGWLPPRSHPAYQALERSAKSYEDAQNILFREEELEDKLQRDGLSDEEQGMLQDIASIKYFLTSTATQLTGYGLDILTDMLYPGAFAILFRNDHFSTIYKPPNKNQLMTLVTDAGYSSHDEIVWQSLVDVNGEGSEFFSGDLRPVGNATSSSGHDNNRAAQNEDQGWTTVTRKSKKASHQKAADAVSPTNSRSEQEDADLALALQLQEEEEEQRRQELATRRREDRLSRTVIAQEQQSPNQHVRTTTTNNRRSSQQIRPLIPPRMSGPVRRNVPSVNRPVNSDEEPPPPSYQQAASTRPFVPPLNHPAHPSASVPSPTSPQATAGAYNASASSYAGYSNNVGRRQSTRGGSQQGFVIPGRSPVGMPIQEESGRKDRDCIIM